MLATRGDGAYGSIERPEIQYDKTRFPKSVLDIENEPRNNQFVKNNNFHPTQKPVELFRYLIRTYTNEGELVLDNTAGSGTTAIACLHENRRFIVMEKELNYFETIKNRVKEFEKTQFNPQLSCGI